ncbi:ATP phosphoribosyltransferase [Vulcanibacillus modesticaldus]|uniref:ATP phosphoribosyltransferase n=1 Tax=Vulcanibacillus modesticaldus TaxID=337097 RepID=A0A1D2YVB7_9BACI|nr:ATP phosphoribosyltransferase [Vulcanibacillus modesticaldus]OEF99565.1 ATP phosphoribosyltransferase [Vulcanibacillus modesticaldus]
MNYLTIALAKGRLGNESIKAFQKIGLGNSIDPTSRKLIFSDKENNISYIFVKPSDVVTYVQNGVADLGIVGKDILLESNANVYEILDLGFGKCKFSIAGIKNQGIYRKDEVLKVATKYPETTKQYFKERQQKIEIIKLNGSVELAPLVGLSDVIVDLVETGNTLKANGLQVIEDMFDISARLIVNRVSYRFKYDQIQNIAEKLERSLMKSDD